MLELARSAVGQASSLIRGPWILGPSGLAAVDAKFLERQRGAEAAS